MILFQGIIRLMLNTVMTFKELLKCLDERIASSVHLHGFKRLKPGHWTRLMKERVDVIWLQQRTGAPLFCVNLGVHYNFLPQCGTEAPISDYRKMEYSACEIKMRLEDESGEHMQWWPISEDSVPLVSDLLDAKADGIFEIYSLDNAFGDVGVTAVLEKRFPPTVKLMTVRALLLFARMHEALGNWPKAITFARAGLENNPGASLGRALRELIHRHE